MKAISISCDFMKDHCNFWKPPIYKLTMQMYHFFSWDQEHAFGVNFQS